MTAIITTVTVVIVMAISAAVYFHTNTWHTQSLLGARSISESYDEAFVETSQLRRNLNLEKTQKCALLACGSFD